MWIRSARKDGRRGLPLRVTKAGVPVLGLAGVLGGGTAWGADPDFTNVADILGGQRHLLRTDDVLVTGTFGANGVPSVLTLQTANSTITGTTTRSDIPLTSAQALSAAGRMFGLPNDVVATLVSDQSNPVNVGVRIVDPVAGTTLFS